MEEQEIYLLISRYLARQTTTEENELLVNWLSESAEHEEIFEQIKTVWDASAPVVVKVTPETTEALYQIKGRIADAPIRFSVWRKASLALASLVVVVLAGLAIYLKNRRTEPTLVHYIWKETKLGQKLTLQLSDGTIVHLAPDSKIGYPERFASDFREVVLRGQAYFKVSHDGKHPFLVHNSQWTIRVLGTEFNVSDFDSQSELSVALLTGKVQVNSLTNHLQYQLKPGQALVSKRKTNEWKLEPFNKEQVTGWMYNRLVFRNESLSEAAIQIERLYGVKVVLTNAATANIHVWGSFDNEPLSEVLEAFQKANSIQYHIKNRTIYLTYTP